MDIWTLPARRPKKKRKKLRGWLSSSLRVALGQEPNAIAGRAANLGDFICPFKLPTTTTTQRQSCLSKGHRRHWDRKAAHPVGTLTHSYAGIIILAEGVILPGTPTLEPWLRSSLSIILVRQTCHAPIEASGILRLRCLS